MVKRILVVDDDPVIRNLMSTLLRRKGYFAAQAANGEEAVALLTASRDHSLIGGEYDLVLLDLMMPRVHGWQVLNFIEDNLEELMPHVVVVSAAGDEHLSMVRQRAFGAVLAKPFDTEAFYDIVRRCLRGPVDPDSDLGPGMMMLFVALLELVLRPY